MMYQYDIDKLLNFLRLDKRKMDIEKIQIQYDTNGDISVVELVYYEPDSNSRAMKKCIIGINGMKINEFAAR